MPYRMDRQQKWSPSWWIENVPRRRERSGFAQSLKEFLHHVSLHGYGKLVEEKKGFAERMIWFGLHMITLGVLIFFLRYTLDEFLYQHMDVTLFDPRYPIEKIPFPTVSICSINRISNASAWEYAKRLSEKDERQRGADFFYQSIKMLAFLYRPRDVVGLTKALYFQGFLDLFDTDDDDIFFDTRKRMHLLTPTCAHILKECHLAGKQFDCMSEFEMSLTKYGYCCTFNSRNKHRLRTRKSRLYGSTQGLSLLLRSLSEDTFYNVHEIDGFIILVHPQGAYADVAAGGVSERFIPSQQDSYLAISPKKTDSVSSIRHYSPKVRSCYFENELPKIYGDNYSLNQCITRCRMRSIMVLCECLPFYYPHEFLDTNTEMVDCTLQHLECLNRYEFKWMNVITQRQAVRGLEHEMEDGLYCPECLPACSDIQYKVSLMSLPLDRFRYSGGRIFNMTDLTKLQLYFAEQTVPVYRKIIKNSFFEVFSTVGNICGIVTGFSLVVVFETLYFLGERLLPTLWEGFMADRNKNGARRQQKLIICP